MLRGGAAVRPFLLLLTAGCGGAPRGMVEIPATAGGPAAFWIDPHEAPSRPGEKPKLNLDLAGAAALCAADGKRLCTAAEWRRACAGPDGTRRFGYGPGEVAGVCHTRRPLPSGHTSMMDPQALVAAAGAFPLCRTPEGVYDLIGNAEEWVLDDWKGNAGSLEGGAWYTYGGYADCTGDYSRAPDYRISPEKAIFSAAARCCWSPTAPDASAIAADAARRLAAARAASSQLPYDPAREVEHSPGLFIDVYEYPNRPKALPVVARTAIEAAEACAAAGKRLCSAAEWERACGGPSVQAYPYGPTFRPGACATDAAGPTTTPAGAHAGCRTPGGVFDLTGSVWEWTSTPLEAAMLRPPGSTAPLHELRGGSARSHGPGATCRPAENYPVAPADVPFPDVGFRCCRGEPAAAPPPAPAPVAPCPAGTVAVSARVCIDAHEYPNTAGGPVRGGLDAEAARAACAEAGKRLCTVGEWVAACEGPARTRWPYGDVYAPGRCHDTSDGAETGGSQRAAGAFADCRSAAGTLDQSGNLWEWADGPRGPVLLGGSWNLSSGLGQCRSQAAANPAFADPQAGTRCCVDLR